MDVEAFPLAFFGKTFSLSTVEVIPDFRCMGIFNVIQVLYLYHKGRVARAHQSFCRRSGTT